VQQVLDVVEGESELLGTLDEAHHPHCVGGVGAVPGAGPLRFRQQAAAFVVPQGLGVNLRLGGDLAGSHPISMTRDVRSVQSVHPAAHQPRVLTAAAHPAPELYEATDRGLVTIALCGRRMLASMS
jgi:hypothetical protein